VLYGRIVARIIRVPVVVNAVTGLGYVFIAQGIKASILRSPVKGAYRLALTQRNGRVLAGNPDDLELFVSLSLVKRSDAVSIMGAGVDMNEFRPSPEPEGAPVVILAARMLWDKGVAELVQAAQSLRNVGVKARFVLVRDSDQGNPASVSTAQLQAWQDSGVVKWWGQRNDMPHVFVSSHIVCLPSYGEGLPKVLVEAESCGRPIVRTDLPGCRHVVKDGLNGILISKKNVSALAEALEQLIENPPLRKQMGAHGRALAEVELSTEKVIAQRLSLYRDLLAWARYLFPCSISTRIHLRPCAAYFNTINRAPTGKVSANCSNNSTGILL